MTVTVEGSHVTESAASRGQILVVGAVAIALVLVGLGLVLNAVLYADTQAAQEPATSGGDATRFHGAVDRGVGGVVFYANYDDHGSYERLTERTRDGTAAFIENGSAHYTASRIGVAGRLLHTTNGTQISQPSAAPFTAADGDAGWTMAADVTGVRRFSANVSRDSLASPPADPSLSDLEGRATRLRATNGTASRTVYLYRNASDHVVVETAADGASRGTCAANASAVTVDLTGGTVDGRDCPSLRFPALDGAFDIDVRHGTNATGRYVAVVDEPRSAVRDSDFADGGACGARSPLATRALYSATLNVSFVTAETRYRTNMTVAPESTPRGRTYAVADVTAAPRELVYTNATGGLFSVATGGTVTEYPVTDAQAIGPKTADLDDDGACEVPYVNSSNVLNVVDEDGTVDALASDAVKSKTLLGVGTWDGHQGVYYVNNSDGKLYRAAPGESPTVVLAADGDGDGIGAVAGIADYNDDGDTDIVFTDGSQHVTYLDGGTTHETAEGVGQNNGIGVGEPRDFDGDGDRRAPTIDGSNNVALLPSSGTGEDLTSSGPAAKAPVAGIDWTGDGIGEVVFVDDGQLSYVTLDGDIEPVRDAAGDRIAAEDDRGVA